MSSIYGAHSHYTPIYGHQFLASNQIWEVDHINPAHGCWRATNKITVDKPIGACYQKLGKHVQALEAYEKALFICRETGDKSVEIRTLLNIGDNFYESGDLEKGLETYQYALKLAQEIGELGAEAVALNSLGLIFGLLGESEKALEAHMRALEIRRIQGDKRGQAASLNNIGCRYADTESDAAKIYFEQALSLIREVGDRVQEASILHNLAVVNKKAGNLPEAIKCSKAKLAL